jgi:hypothetical protein
LLMLLARCRFRTRLTICKSSEAPRRPDPATG